MKTKEFIQYLREHENLPLQIEYAEGKFVRSDFHITEIKNVNFDTVDCGGVRNQWEETHVQIWESDLPDPAHNLNSSKAVKIFDLVEKVRPTFQDTEIKFEYGNKDFHTALMDLGSISNIEGQIHIQLFKTSTTCKAMDRASSPEEKAVACCPSPKKKVKVSLKSLTSTKSAKCAPESNCC
ncbi:hypothetical protein KZP23_19055 [Echinicola marina]|uniref:DUF6428 family protein n=1 Tax=Echinicola marina TaxID=2859768 RepID=UPI001CF6C234|nr:DUF6428 family protein [Echinicola marina]UCS92754.1 hypothetical protein KZP23_19055 [Echinicola marina]